jgi:hypothetical protein
MSDDTGGPAGTAFCRHCDEIIWSDDLGTWIDERSGGDVCGWNGGNEPHEPDTEQDILRACPRSDVPHTLAECLAAEHERSAT